MSGRKHCITKVNPRLIEDNSEPWAAQYQAKHQEKVNYLGPYGN